MNYSNENGKVGTYRGYDVCIVDYEKLKPGDNTGTIFAVRIKNRKNFIMVQNDLVVGTMRFDGSVEMSRRIEKFKFYKAPEVVAEEKTETEVKEYKEYSKTVDNFFDGLEKLWQEIGV